MNDRLARMMEARGVSIRGLSRATGLSVSSVRRALRSASHGSVYTWILIADALGCRLDDIVGGDDDGE